MSNLKSGYNLVVTLQLIHCYQKHGAAVEETVSRTSTTIPGPASGSTKMSAVETACQRAIATALHVSIQENPDCVTN